MRTIKTSLGFLYDTAVTYPAPANLNYNYNFGVYALTILALQIVSGIFLVMFYCSDASLAFLSVEHIMRDVPYGWFVRYLHANGASFFFIVVYIHMFRGLLYGSYFYPRRLLWCSGVIILLLMIITSFLVMYCMGPNVLLGCYRYYKSSLNSTLLRPKDCVLALERIFSRKSNSYEVF